MSTTVDPWKQLNRSDRSIFFGTARRNGRFVSLHAALGVVMLLSTVGFTSLLALYLGHDVLSLGGVQGLQWLVGNPANVLVLATAAALVGLLSRTLQAIVEAHVASEREQWFAQSLRDDENSQRVAGNIARASNYYGRLAVASMRAVSTIAILALNFVAIGLLLPPGTALAGMVCLAVIAALLFVAMRRLSAAMSSSASSLSANAKGASAWKINRDVPRSAEVDAYFRAYFYRIFLASSFGLVGPLFGLVFCVAIILLREIFHVEFGLAQAFVAFAVLQSYVALMGKLFGSFVHGAAFIPAVRPYLGRPANENGGDVDLEVIDELG